ncbi:MAG: hypothetical protein R3Y11_07865 [Pseudomonadota bacterium]
MISVGDKVIVVENSQERTGTVIMISGWVCCVEFPDGTQTLCPLSVKTTVNQ